MGLSTREQQALHSIEDGLAISDPRLASRLAMFNRLNAGDAIPARENIRARRLRWRLAWPLLWLITTVALIAFGLAVGQGGGRGTCAIRALACAVRTAASTAL